MAKTKDHKAREIQVQNLPDSGLALLISLKPLRRNSGFGCLSWPEQQSREQVSVGLVLICICVEILLRQEVTRLGDSLHDENQCSFGKMMWAMTDVTELLTYKSVCASERVQQYLCHTESHPWDLITLGIVQFKQKH